MPRALHLKSMRIDRMKTFRVKPSESITCTYKRGFTLVELLIAIVVIAILAAVSVVAYDGIQNRAYDAAVVSDLRNVAKKYELFKIDRDKYPTTAAEMRSLQLKVTKSAYGNGYLNNRYNLLICRLQTNPQEFTIVAASKSGTVFTYQKDGSITESSAWVNNNANKTCQSTGIDSVTIFDAINFYGNSAWESYIEG